MEVSGDVANTGNARTYARANLVGDPKLSDPTAARWFNTAAFAIPVNSFGTAGRNILRTDGVWNADFGLQKNISVGEGRDLQLRFEAFNLFNHIDLGNPEHRIAQTNTFGRVTSTSHQPRQLQFGSDSSSRHAPPLACPPAGHRRTAGSARGGLHYRCLIT